jgi:hypothetical protein
MHLDCDFFLMLAVLEFRDFEVYALLSTCPHVGYVTPSHLGVTRGDFFSYDPYHNNSSTDEIHGSPQTDDR